MTFEFGDTSPREEIFLTIPDIGAVEGYVEEQTEYGPVAILDYVEVDESRRGEGNGSKLVRMFTNVALGHGARRLETVAIEPALGRIMGHVFGPENVHGIVAANGHMATIAYDEALRQLDSIAAVAADYPDDADIPDNVTTGVRMAVDLTSNAVIDRLRPPEPGAVS